MTGVVSLAALKNDNKLVTPAQALRECADDIDSGKLQCDKLLIIPLDASEGKYDAKFYAVNMRLS